jgi:hypothetical protein
MNSTTSTQKKPRYKKHISFTTRATVLGILIILFIYTSVSAYTAYQTPTTKKIETTILHYNHNGQFYYTASLKNNTLYNNKTTLRPGEGTFFTQLISQVDASFSEIYHIDQDAHISGNYTIEAILETNLWTKTCPLVNRTPFTAQGRTAQFTTLFPVNCTYYEELLSKINEETGVSSPNPKLIIRCTVMMLAITTNATSSSVFSPSINVSLNQKTIEFPKNLTSYLPGVVTTNNIVNLTELPTQQILWAALSLIFLASIPLFMLTTTSSTTPKNATYNELKKIKKKYGEWIIETKTEPTQLKPKMISVSTLKDLSKVGEELGKPILLYSDPNEHNHKFYILDETVMYEYDLTP